MKFAFKKDAWMTGLASIGQKRGSDIKLKGKRVGRIDNIDYSHYHIRFAFKREPTPEDPAPFKWVGLAKRFETEQHARDYLTARAAEILARYGDQLHYLDD